MTIQEALQLLEEVKEIGGTAKAIFALPRAQFLNIMSRYGEAQYTFYKAEMYDKEDELAELETFYHERQYCNV